MATEYTPGPWAIIRDGAKLPLIVTELTEQYGIIAQVRKDSLENGYDEANANAHLIAAAPDMLEALKGLLANAPVPKRIKDDFSYILYREAASKAIAKAEGRS